MSQIEERRLAFVRAFFSPGPTFQDATASYMLAFPDANRGSARRAASRLLNNPDVKAMAEQLRQAAFAQGALTLSEFIKWGWEMLAELRQWSKEDPKYSTAIPNLYDRVGKAAGFMVQRVEDMTPPERRLPMGSAELITATRAALERMERLNKPNPLPMIAAPLDRHATEDADYEIDHDDGPDEAQAEAS